MDQTWDFLVVGSGISGLWFALRAAEHGTVCVVTKREAIESNTRYAQGGLAEPPQRIVVGVQGTIDVNGETMLRSPITTRRCSLKGWSQLTWIWACTFSG